MKRYTYKRPKPKDRPNSALSLAMERTVKQQRDYTPEERQQQSKRARQIQALVRFQ